MIIHEQSTKRPVDEPIHIQAESIKDNDSEEEGFPDMKVDKKNLFKSVAGSRPTHENPF